VPKKCGPAAGDGGPRNDLEEHTPPSFRSDLRQSATVAPATPDAPAPTRAADRLDSEIAAPPHVLSWRSASERNRKLRAWQRAVLTTFGEQPRALRIAWVLHSLFNVRTGFAHPSNPYLARETGLLVNKVQDGLMTLEKGGAIVRVVTRSNSVTRREIYPAATLVGRTPTVGVRGDPQHPGVQNLRRYAPRSQLAYARAASVARDQRAERAEAAEAAGKAEE
jgi:hypothetical protein